MPGIYAVGDNTGAVELTPVVATVGRRLSERLFNSKSDEHPDYNNIPTVTFNYPPTDIVGLAEQQAREQYDDSQMKVYKFSPTTVYTAVTSHRRPCCMKLIRVGPEERIVSIHGAGFGMDEVLQGFAMALKMGVTKEGLDSIVAIRLTTTEKSVIMCQLPMYRRYSPYA